MTRHTPRQTIASVSLVEAGAIRHFRSDYNLIKKNPKKFKPSSELVELLESRNLTIFNKKWAIKILDYENYYYVINGYNKIFLNTTNPEDQYKTDSTFNEIIALYTFDRTLREKLLIELLRVEHVIKTRIVHIFSKYHGHDHTSYLCAKSFNITSDVNKRRAENLITDMNELIDSKRKKHGSIKHYFNNYGYVPLWVLAKVMTFGKLNSFYSCMRNEEKQEVAEAFGLRAKEFRGIIDFIANLRNKCAHGERIYCHSKDAPIPKPIPHLKEHDLLEIPANASGYRPYGTQDILALLIVLRYFLSPTRYNNLLKKIDYSLHKKLAFRLHSIDVSVVKNAMGLNCDWLKLRL